MGKRGPKKGWKREQMQKTNTKAVKDENGQVVDSLVDPLVNAKQDETVVFGMDRREELYKRADENNYNISSEEIEEEVVEETAEATTETVEEETAVEVLSEATPEEVETEVSEEGTAVSEFTEVVKPPEEEVKKTEETLKTVPLAALHEAREKGKAKDTRIEELERQLAERPTQQPEVTESDEYKDPEIVALEKRITDMESSSRENDNALANAQHENNVRLVDEGLRAKGIEGFATVGRKIVDSTLRQMYMEDAINAQAHDTQEGWEKIYLEALPALQAIGREQHKTELFNSKTENKKEAQTITSSGKNTETIVQPTKKLTQEQQYMQERQNNRL